MGARRATYRHDGIVMLVVRNTIWLAVCRIAADLLGLVLFTVISRRYGPAACLMFPRMGLLRGLFPNPRHSPLFA
jgi:hypothetical protein